MILLPPFDHCVYVPRDINSEALYVGVTSHLFNRLYQHSSKSWWPSVKSIDIESFPTRVEADAREIELIRILQTPNNDKGNSRALLDSAGITAQDVKQYLAARKESVDRKEGWVTLKEFGQMRDIKVTVIRNWRDRYPDFPSSVGHGVSNVSYYMLGDLEAWYKSSKCKD